MFGHVNRLSLESGASICSRSRLVAACVIARLPAVWTTNTRSPGRWNTKVLRKVLIWSTPALVLESDRKTSPVSSSMPTQYVMEAKSPSTVFSLSNELCRSDTHVHHFAAAPPANATYGSRIQVVAPDGQAAMTRTGRAQVRDVDG